MFLRRLHALWVMRSSRDAWPIDPSSADPPAGWLGWPDGKRFAFVLTHDVEGPVGLNRVKLLAELEMSLGLRSSFNFVPEGSYEVPASLLSWLTERGFEVGVHDLNHDGKLYWSRASFQRKAERINHHLNEWQAVGFRSGFMLHNLEWIHDLDIAYDASTFDTDPFEPQPDGAGTIFPFWVPAPAAAGDHGAEAGRSQKPEPSESTDDGPQTSPLLNADLRPLSSVLGPPTSDFRPPTSAALPRSGYVELPYTLVQDSTLFLLLREPTNTLWEKKLDWIVQRGGMALLNTHPDYMSFDSEKVGSLEFSAERYADFLRQVTSRYAETYWHALPREVAARCARAHASDAERHHFVNSANS